MFTERVQFYEAKQNKMIKTHGLRLERCSGAFLGGMSCALQFEATGGWTTFCGCGCQNKGFQFSRLSSNFSLSALDLEAKRSVQRTSANWVSALRRSIISKRKWVSAWIERSSKVKKLPPTWERNVIKSDIEMKDTAETKSARLANKSAIQRCVLFQKKKRNVFVFLKARPVEEKDLP